LGTGEPRRDALTPNPPRTRKGRIAGRIDLDYLPGFPLRQEVALPFDPGSQVEAVTRAVVEEAGYSFYGASDARPPPDGTVSRSSVSWTGERGLRRRGTSASTRIPMAVVFVGGIVLGAVDAYITNSLLVGAYWVLGGAGVAGLFWLRYGGDYDSDLIQVTVARSAAGPPPTPRPVSVVISAARIQSQIRASVRVPAMVTGPLRLAREIGSMGREIQRRLYLGGASTRPTSQRV